MEPPPPELGWSFIQVWRGLRGFAWAMNLRYRPPAGREIERLLRLLKLETPRRGSEDERILADMQRFLQLQTKITAGISKKGSSYAIGSPPSWWKPPVNPQIPADAPLETNTILNPELMRAWEDSCLNLLRKGKLVCFARHQRSGGHNGEYEDQRKLVTCDWQVIGISVNEEIVLSGDNPSLKDAIIYCAEDMAKTRPPSKAVLRAQTDDKIRSVLRDIYDEHKDDPPNVVKVRPMVRKRIREASNNRIEEIMREPEFSARTRQPGRQPSRK